jgi:adenosylcobinamide-GDP ribazoletransferase
MRYLFIDSILAWQLLTVVPLPGISGKVERPGGRVVPYFPLVGLVLGALLLMAAWSLQRWLPAPLSAALLLVLWTGLTGLLHLDGFMDSCDGLLPPRNPERRLEIMKDSRVGAFGVVGGILLLLVKFSGLLALPNTGQPALLLLLPVLGRWSMSWSMARFPLARSEGMAAFFKKELAWRPVLLVTVLVAAVTLLLLGSRGAILLLITWLTTVLVARFAMARLGGLSGDVYGATCELVEAIALVTAVAIWS